MNGTSSTQAESHVRDGLRRLVAANPHASSFLILLATQKRSPRITTADHLRVQLRTECNLDLTKGEARDLLRDIAATGAAVYTKGTRFGHSRVQWNYRTTTLGRVAHGEGVELKSWGSSRVVVAKSKSARAAEAKPRRRAVTPSPVPDGALASPAAAKAEGTICVKCGTGQRWIEITAPITGVAEPTIGAAIVSAMQALDASLPGGDDPTPPFSLLRKPA